MELRSKSISRGLHAIAIATACALLCPTVGSAAPPEVRQPSPVTPGSDSAIASLLNIKNDLTQAFSEFQDVNRFYQRRGFEPAWTAPFGEQDAEIAMSILEHAADEGLNPADYHVGAIRMRRAANSVLAKAELDVLLTDGVLAYARDMHEGRARRGTFGFPVDLPRSTFDTVGDLARAVAAHRVQQFLLGVQAPHREYVQLKTALTHYRAIARDGGWGTISGPLDLDLASADARVALLRRRLAAEDPSFSSEPTSETDLVYALARYQRRNQLVPGSLNKEPLAALNVPAAVRADQIAANMERWRWFWRAFENRHIEVNSASATLAASQNGATVMKSKIIAGKSSSPTPIFRADAIAVTINPSWNIPDTIARREILPKARRNPSYLTREHIVADRPGGGLRQVPGAWNALGRIKLEMPNRFSSYLHDTSAPGLFARQDRHLSHGYMRVEQIKQLASVVIGGDNSGVATIEAAIRTGKTRRTGLKKAVPVYVGYWTALPDDSGAIAFAQDVYGLDRKVLSAMRGEAGVARRVSVLTECSDAK